ncbi:unnamed protein product [marine sediment metagenome]|uniref:Uncharacterized protein n=1 Tax=marine sediment metagenome TaxID=412755 RepID=X1RUX5_9ZZZZ
MQPAHNLPPSFFSKWLRTAINAIPPTTADEKEIIKRFTQLRGWQADDDDVLWLQGLRSEYPGFTLAEFKACVDYHSGKPVPKHKGIWKNRFRNWMIKKRDFEMKEGKGEQVKGKRAKVHPREDFRGRAW